ncbi:MAG: LysR family transcriptional regulator [Streptosporangiaceae bacterium]|nr:LysR family transcriptional regulator [Streptosporangiaceae bacterium]
MDLRQMRYMLAVAEHGNVRRAAASLHLAQQSLSGQIGAPLFLRHRGGMSLTPVGEVFVAHASNAVDAADRVLTATRSAARSLPAEPVRLAVATGLSALAGQLLRRYPTLHQDVDVRLADLRSTDQITALNQREITAGLAYTPLPKGTALALSRTHCSRHRCTPCCEPTTRSRRARPCRCPPWPRGRCCCPLSRTPLACASTCSGRSEPMA